MIPTQSADEITPLLQAIRAGDQHAAARLYALLYPEIKRLAHSRLHAWGVSPVSTPPAWCMKGFLRMVERVGMAGESRAQFFAYVGKVLRSVVLDHLRANQAEKRGGDLVQVTLSQAESIAVDGRDNWFLLDSALEQLRALDLGLYELVELRYFAGLTVADIAKLLGVSSRTVDRDWVKAKAWLESLIESTA